MSDHTAPCVALQSIVVDVAKMKNTSRFSAAVVTIVTVLAQTYQVVKTGQPIQPPPKPADTAELKRELDSMRVALEQLNNTTRMQGSGNPNTVARSTP
jgi:hypothetical protein